MFVSAEVIFFFLACISECEVLPGLLLTEHNLWNAAGWKEKLEIGTLCLTLTQDTTSRVPRLQLRACLALGLGQGLSCFSCLAGVPCKRIQDMENQTVLPWFFEDVGFEAGKWGWTILSHGM